MSVVTKLKEIQEELYENGFEEHAKQKNINLANNQSKPIPYHQLIKEIEESGQQCHLLLGKDFNNSLGQKVDYQTIVDRMINDETSFNLIEKDIEASNSDIDKVVLDIKKWLVDKSDDSAFLGKFVEKKVETNFMKAASKLVREIVKNGDYIKDRNIYLLFKNVNKHFHINYNNSCFTLLMRIKKNRIDKIQTLVFLNTVHFRDKVIHKDFETIYETIKEAYSVGDFGINVNSRKGNTKFWDMSRKQFHITVNLYYKDHNPRWTYKAIERASNKVWDVMHDQYNDSDQNENDDDDDNNTDFLSLQGNFGNYEDLFTQIDGSKYSEICYQKTSGLSGCMIILGGSLLEKDQYIHNAIIKSNVSKVYMYYKGRQHKKELEQATKLFPKKTVFLFDFSK